MIKAPNEQRGIAWLSCPHGVMVMDDGESVPITNFYDSDGDELEPPFEDFGDIFAVVAGPDRNGEWWTVDLTAMEPVEDHLQ